MNNYFIIISQTDIKDFSKLKSRIESTGKTTFIPLLDIESNDLHGIRIFEELKNSNNVVVLLTPYLQEDEKAMDQVFLAYSLKPEKIKIWEPESFKLSHELKSYLKKSQKFNNLNELLGIKELESSFLHKRDETTHIVEENASDLQFVESNVSDVQKFSVTSEAVICQEMSPSNNQDTSIMPLNFEETNNDSTSPDEQKNSEGINNQREINNGNTEGRNIDFFVNPSNTDEKNGDIDKIFNVKFSITPKLKLSVEIDCKGENGVFYTIDVYLKKASKNKFKKKGTINAVGQDKLITNNLEIENYDLPVDHDKTNEIDVKIELFKNIGGSQYEMVDEYSTVLKIYHYFNFIAKSIYEIRD
ncbi:MAG: hypothetical protein J1E82_04200 [Muribaculaceae bacterium]|nr:hypothetical protein [Muribaculaceae bacterium]